MGLDRRTFLQQAGLAWLTWGTTETGILSLVNHSHLTTLAKNYQQTLRQSTSRKLALLVGINRYAGLDDLAGCLMDVELQRELLVHRFGFNPDDILTLSDRQATRENIETAFVEHLIRQAKPDDVVVFHFSGYGGQIKMPLSPENKAASPPSNEAFRLVNSFVPVDGFSGKQASIANNILQETLLVLAQSLSTTKCMFVLDNSFNTTPRSQHNSFKIRSLSELAQGTSSEELSFLNELRNDLATKGLKPSKRLLSLPGVVLSATGNNQIAVERKWDNMSAGLFTFALTQHLWHITPSSKVQVALARTAETVEQIMGRQQQPTLNNPEKRAIAYYLATDDAPQATGVISKIGSNGNNIEVKLLGLPMNILDSYGVNSCLSFVPDPENTVPQLQIKSKDGLVSKTQLLSSSTTELPTVGSLVRESIRMLKRDRSLTLALDAQLGRIERVDATSALSNIPAIDSVVVAGEHNADCLLGKVTKNSTAQPETADSNPEKLTFSYGLYTAGGNLIAKTTGLEEEAVKIALDRLQPQFNSLLAAKWLELTCNEFSSRLKAGVTFTNDTEQRSNSWYRGTFATDKQPESRNLTYLKTGSGLDSGNNVPILVKNTEIRLTLNNTGEQQLYALILGVDSDCNIFAVYTPTESTLETEVQLKDLEIASGSKLMIPSAASSWKWKVPESTGINTLYVVLAVRPFEQTLKAFANQQNYKLNQEQVLNVTNPIDVVNALLQDLHDNSSVEPQLLPGNDVYALDVKRWATLNFVYEVSNS